MPDTVTGLVITDQIEPILVFIEKNLINLYGDPLKSVVPVMLALHSPRPLSDDAVTSPSSINDKNPNRKVHFRGIQPPQVWVRIPTHCHCRNGISSIIFSGCFH
jgi:hypothetical protein